MLAVAKRACVRRGLGFSSVCDLVVKNNNLIDLVIIDDDEAVRDSLGALLHLSGFRVQCFDSASGFLHANPALDPAAIIVDLCMPAMSGLELVERLRRSGSLTPIILVSGRIKDSDRRRATELKIEKVLEKPFTDDAILAALAEIGVTQDDRRFD